MGVVSIPRDGIGVKRRDEGLVDNAASAGMDVMESERVSRNTASRRVAVWEARWRHVVVAGE